MKASLGPATTSVASSLNLASAGGTVAKSKSADSKSEVKSAFQDFVAGTFYQQMLKAMRKSTSGKPAYFHGGQAEEMFRGQMDQQISEDMARHHGASLAEPLFKSFSSNLWGKSESLKPGLNVQA